MGDFQTIFQSQSFQDGTVGCHRCLRRNPSSEQTLRAGIMTSGLPRIFLEHLTLQ